MDDAELEDLVDEVSTLKKRVEYLEDEVDVSYERDRFERLVISRFPDDAEIEFRDGFYGYFAQVTNIDGDDVQQAMNKLDTVVGSNSDYGYAVTETGVGLGMEVWNDPSKR